MGKLFKELMLNSTHCYPQYGSFHRGPFVLSAVYDKDKSNPSISQTKFGGGKKEKKSSVKNTNETPLVRSFQKAEL